MLEQIKYLFAEKIKQNPRVMPIIWNMMPRLTFLLPHDRSYYGLKHICSNPSGLFLDIGANNGITAAGFAKINPHYNILSLEANVIHEKSLARLRDKHSTFDYKIIGVGESAGELELHTPVYRGTPIHTHTSIDVDYLKTSLGRDYAPKIVAEMEFETHRVEIATVDSLNLSPDVVKIDVEGADYQVLLGMQETIEKYRPYFLIEFTPEHMQDFFRFFADRDYVLFTYDFNSDCFSSFDLQRETEAWSDNHLQVNIYCVPKEKSHSLPLS